MENKFRATKTSIAKLASIRFLLSITIDFDLEVEQTNVKIAFLQGDLEEEIYMSHLEGFTLKQMEDQVCKLK
jgi:hypothetical protein